MVVRWQGMKEKISNGDFTGERALFNRFSLKVTDSLFHDGESPLKEGKDLEVTGCTFAWKYPLWYGTILDVENCLFKEEARAGIWYSKAATFRNCRIDAPKCFRRCSELSIKDCDFGKAEETLWNCDAVSLENITAKGTYFAMGSKNLKVKNLHLVGDYGFDSCENLEIRNSTLITKDAFWNCKNVTLINCTVEGEYFGWNSDNVTLINCRVKSHQGFCYMKFLKLENCVLEGSDLIFEYCTLDADVKGSVESIKNPSAGRIKVEKVGELILESDKIDPYKTEIRIG